MVRRDLLIKKNNKKTFNRIVALISVPNASQPITYLTGASHLTTLRRQGITQQTEQKQVPRTATLPRSLSHGSKENQQFYYG